MYEGKLVFAQLMDHLPMHTFRRTVARFGGERWVKSFSCQEQFRAMAFAQLTYRESLRDIETCLSAQASKLYHMGFREPVRRSTSSIGVGMAHRHPALRTVRAVFPHTALQSVVSSSGLSR